ncbi:MAG TPA: ATPase domain-containing protein [Planctomycetota bacterium]|nr:ATPase domain-containing protein [Planctomycetota bacterium]
MSDAALCSTGIAGLDAILDGGLPRDRLSAIEGPAGVGKTTLGLQFLLEGVRRGEKGLYISLSETKAELQAVARSHGWSLDGLAVVELSSLQQMAQPVQSTVFHSSELELNHITQSLIRTIEEAEPRRVVFDSLFELRLLAQAPIRYRRQLLALKQFFAERSATVLLLEDRTSVHPDMQVDNMVNGVIRMESLKTEFGAERRRLSIVKMRGAGFTGGNHDYLIRKGGMEVFPRLITVTDDTGYAKANVSSGIPNLDALVGGGLARGTSSLVMGPAGCGKSIIVTQFAHAAAERGDGVMILSFEESTRNLLERARLLHMPLDAHVAAGRVVIMPIDPAELTPGELASRVMERIVRDDVRMVVIDSLNGYLQAMPQEQFLVLHLHELLSHLGRHGVVTLMVLAQHGLIHSIMTPADVTYLADNVIVVRYFEALGRVRKAISVVKKRNGPHENTIRELSIADSRLVIGDVVQGLQGVLTGVPAMAPESALPAAKPADPRT